MFDYEIRKALYEQSLVEMAMSTKNAKALCENLNLMFKLHLAKCFLFYNSAYYDHWLKECANFCIRCDDMRLKPKAKRPDEQFFLETLFDEIETANDAKHYLNAALDRVVEFEREDATNDEALKFLDLFSSLREELADYLSDEDIFDSSDYKEIIDSAIKAHL